MRLSSLDKVMYPGTGTTKAEVLDYYARISPVLLPHLAGRPVTRVRFPHGVGDVQFFEKNVPAGTPAWLRRAGRDPVFPFIDDLAGLPFFANLHSIELAVPQCRCAGEGKGAAPRPADPRVIDTADGARDGSWRSAPCSTAHGGVPGRPPGGVGHGPMPAPEGRLAACGVAHARLWQHGLPGPRGPGDAGP